MTTSKKKKKSTSVHISRPYANHARTIRFHRNANNRIGSSISHSVVSATTSESALTVEGQLHSHQPASEDISTFQYDAGLPDGQDSADYEPRRKQSKLRTRMNVMEEWREYRDTYLQEMLRHDGREGLQVTTCAGCGARGDFACNDCAYRLHYCQQCMIDRHQFMPLHRIQVRLLALHIYITMRLSFSIGQAPFTTTPPCRNSGLSFNSVTGSLHVRVRVQFRRTS